MSMKNKNTGLSEIRKIRKESRSLYWTVALFSLFVNILMLTGPLYMLQVYDRVLGSRSVETLVAFSILLAFLFGMMGILDFTRARILSRIGARFQSRLDKRVFAAVLDRSAVGQQGTTQNTLRDLEAVQRLLSSNVLTALFDVPWAPFFLFGITIFHPWLGALALAGGLILISIATLNQLSTRNATLGANQSVMVAEIMSEQLRSEAEMVHSLGMRNAAFNRWNQARGKSLDQTILSSDKSSMFTTMSKTFRLFLQSAMLGLGAYLVLLDQLTPGAMIAASILLGRALAPIELAIGQWAVVQRAAKGWTALSELLSEVPPDQLRTQLPTPQARLEAKDVTVIPPGTKSASLRMVSFLLQPGQALGVIGQSGSGKSTLARALTGVWKPAGGFIRLDGATLDQYDPDVLGAHVGYLPQRVQLFNGTIKENIARLQAEPDDAMVVKAAKQADAHAMITKLPDGYDTFISANGSSLSGGQIQRVGLARALYGDPVILVLDEPNSNLDNEGSIALNTAIKEMKKMGKSVLIMAHRPSAIQECDMLMVLEDGLRKAYGPKDEVLQSMIKNHAEIKRTASQGGVS